MIKTTVQAVGFVGAGFVFRCRENGWLCSGAPLATGGHLTMIRFGVRTRAKRAEGSLEQADPGIRMMTEFPAMSALDKADAFLGRSNDKAIPTIYEGFSNEVLHRETTMGVVDIEPHCPQVRGMRVLREARRMIFV